VLKLSGEVLGNRSSGECIDPDALASMARRVARVVELGVQIGIVLGGGNIFRGLKGESKGVNRTTGDNMGMLATIINGLAMQNALEHLGLETRLQTAIEMHQVAEPFIQRKAVRHLDKGRVVIFAGGTGNPYFSTDTAAALRAAQMGAEVLLKATKVDGVFSADPDREPGAERFSRLRYRDVLQRRLQVMDLTAITLCMERRIPIRVFNMLAPGNLAAALGGADVGTLVTE